jgi:hypothetical protein
MDLDSLEPVVDDATRRAYAIYRRDLSGRGFDPYYSEEIPRFELRDDDVLVVPRDARVEPDGCGAVLVSTQAHARLEVCGVSETDAVRALAAIDGVRTFGEVRRTAGIDGPSWDRIASAAFGRLIFAPSAVAALEQRVPGTEIVRFAGSPYEIVRSYWENMANVSSRLSVFPEALPEALRSTTAFVRLLRELHALALVGESGRSFYRPASPILERESAGIGEFLRAESVTEEMGEGTRFVSGPRVGAGLIGGAFYHELLIESVEDPEALARARVICDASGLSWGRVVTARAEGDEVEAPWFCPPRPLSPSHFEALRSDLSDALFAAPEDAVVFLARFHWAFVRLHPFAFANQCLAMSLVNHALRRMLGAGMSHHVLDHLALRLSRAAYTRVFGSAVRAWLVRDASSVRRTLELVARKRRAFDLLRGLEAEASVAGARRLAAERSDDALLVLLSVSPSA